MYLLKSFLLALHGSRSLGHAYIGRWNTQDSSEGGAIRPVVDYIPHPDYVPVEATGEYNPDNDIAILKLDRAPTSNFGVIKMNFDPTYPAATGEELLMLGWGSITNTIDEPSQISDILQQATTSYIAFEDCAVAYDPETGIRYGFSTEDTVVGPDWFCTNDPEHAHCHGDSGGPIIRLGESAEDDLLIGVISRYVVRIFPMEGAHTTLNSYSCLANP